MNKWNILFLGVLGSYFVICAGREPFKALPKSVPFLVYYASRYRGMCVGILVARTVVLTAAVCVVNPVSTIPDTRPINVVTGSMYRHPRRGIRVQVTKIIHPKLVSDLSHRAHQLEKSVALLLMKKKVPDIIAEIPLRALEIDYRGEESLKLQEECLLTGWHFFYKGDKIYPAHKFLLQRNVRAQFVNIVKMHEWCAGLNIKLVKTLTALGFNGVLDKNAMVCVKDGMYGAPFICGGRAVGMLMAPDAQWSNCTGFSNIIHTFSSQFLRPFFTCTSRLYTTETRLDWSMMKKALYDEVEDVYDYIPAIYDRVVVKGSHSTETDEL